MFKTHFDDDHFRMCLRFVAGLTHLEHENYQQYFNKQLNLQCRRNPLSLGIGSSFFHQNADIEQCNHSSFRVDDSDNFPTFLIRLLYESQNTTLCQVLAQSINNHELCLDGVSLSLFDWLCLSYFMNNSSSTWNHLHLGDVDDQTLSVFTAGLTNNSLQTIRLGIDLSVYNDELVHTFFHTSLLCNVQEFYCDIKAQPSCIHLFRLPILMILHLRQDIEDEFTDWNELEKCIEMNSSIQEIKFECSGNGKLVTSAFTSVIRGVTRNNTVTSLTLYTSCHGDSSPPLPDGVIEQLLKYNNTLKALSLDIPDDLLPSSLNIVELNTPLTALDIRSSKLMTPHIKGLRCLILHEPYSPQLIFQSNPSLHTISLPIDTDELFTILQTNTALKALRVEIGKVISSIGPSLQNMLKQSQSLKYVELISTGSVYDHIPVSFLTFLTAGVEKNNGIQQLNVPVPLSDTQEVKDFFKVTTQKGSLSQLEVDFRPDESYELSSNKKKKQTMISLYERLNYLFTGVTIRILGMEYEDFKKGELQLTCVQCYLYSTSYRS